VVVTVMAIAEEAGLAVEADVEVEDLHLILDQAGGLHHMREEDRQVAAGLLEKEKDLFLTRENVAAAHPVAETSQEERTKVDPDPDLDLKPKIIITT